MSKTLLEFLDKIEGEGYGGMFAFESARTDAKGLAAENERLRAERDHYRSEYVRLMTAPQPNGFVFVDGRVIGGRDE